MNAHNRAAWVPIITHGVLVVLWIHLLAGCTMVGPDYERPEADVQKTWTESGDARIKTDSVDLREWWKLLSDPVLDRLVAQA